jgi:hypothetical protein
MAPASGTCSGTYDACGCGCCGGVTPVATCYFPSAGDSLDAIIATDRTAAAGTTCASAGCSQGKRYLCCVEAGPEPAGSAQYAASNLATGVDLVAVTRTAPDGSCVTLVLVRSTAMNPAAFRVPQAGQWSVQSAQLAATCTAGSGTNAIGAQGTVTLGPGSSAPCVVGAHLTVFFAGATTDAIATVRMDADGIAISQVIASGFCQ